MWMTDPEEGGVTPMFLGLCLLAQGSCPELWPQDWAFPGSPVG